MAGPGNARMVAGAAAMLLLTVFAGCAAAQVTGKEHVILTNSQPNNSLRLASVALSNFKGTLGKTLKLQPSSDIGDVVATAVTKDGLAFTTSAKVHTSNSSVVSASSYITVSNVSNPSDPKVVVTHKLGGLASGALKGCPLTATDGKSGSGDIAVSSSADGRLLIHLTVKCSPSCSGGRYYVISYFYHPATKKFTGPNKEKYLISSASCNVTSQTGVKALKVVDGHLYAVVSSLYNTSSQAALYQLKDRKKIAVGVTTATSPAPHDCRYYTIKEPGTAFYAECYYSNTTGGSVSSAFLFAKGQAAARVFDFTTENSLLKSAGELVYTLQLDQAHSESASVRISIPLTTSAVPKKVVRSGEHLFYRHRP